MDKGIGHLSMQLVSLVAWDHFNAKVLQNSIGFFAIKDFMGD